MLTNKCSAEKFTVHLILVKELMDINRIHVNIVNGQFDLITSTPGTVSWVEKIVGSEWDIPGGGGGLDKKRGIINVRNALSGYFKQRKLLTQYTILTAGHGLISETPMAVDWFLKKIIKANPSTKSDINQAAGAGDNH